MAKKRKITDSQIERWCGWVPNPAATRKIVKSLPYPRFAEAAPDLVEDSKKRDTDALLWDACKKVTGGHLVAKKQSIGCCVSMGYSTGVDALQCVEIALKGEAEEFHPVSHAAIYGMARELGGMLGGGDGLYGSVASQSVSTLGVVTDEFAKDSPTDDKLAKEWGRRGAPAEIKSQAKNNLVKTVSQVKTAAECKAALQNGYPVPVCSGVGFTMTRDNDGFCKASGSWAHCMAILGYRADKDAFCIIQSWGNNTPDGPCTLGQPDYSFWVTSATINKMLKEGDSFALSAFNGFPARELNWLI